MDVEGSEDSGVSRNTSSAFSSCFKGFIGICTMTSLSSFFAVSGEAGRDSSKPRIFTLLTFAVSELHMLEDFGLKDFWPGSRIRWVCRFHRNVEKMGMMQTACVQP